MKQNNNQTRRQISATQSTPQIFINMAEVILTETGAISLGEIADIISGTLNTSVEPLYLLRTLRCRFKVEVGPTVRSAIVYPSK